MSKSERTGGIARATYEQAILSLQKTCNEELEMELIVNEDEFPLRVSFIPRVQIDMFDGAEESGEVHDLTVSVGMSCTVQNTMSFKMDSKVLKKLIREAEKIGTLYYLAYREDAGKVGGIR